MTREELAGLIDHTQVRAYATELDLASLCDEGRANAAGALHFTAVS